MLTFVKAQKVENETTTRTAIMNKFTGDNPISLSLGGVGNGKGLFDTWRAFHPKFEFRDSPAADFLWCFKLKMIRPSISPSQNVGASIIVRSSTMYRFVPIPNGTILHIPTGVRYVFLSMIFWTQRGPREFGGSKNVISEFGEVWRLQEVVKQLGCDAPNSSRFEVVFVFPVINLWVLALKKGVVGWGRSTVSFFVVKMIRFGNLRAS